MRHLRALALSLALAAPAAADDVAIPMADGNVLRGERVDDPAVAGKGLRLRTGGVTVFVPWNEMAPGTRELLEKGGTPLVPLGGPPVAPGAGPAIEPPPPVEEAPAVEEMEWAPGEPPPCPACCDPRF
ncbi:MAG: hypothetical protein K8T20_09445 [Planctomycetes bacterium]|nr:hypothetical protein [Planctomycetota bacterium]